MKSNKISFRKYFVAVVLIFLQMVIVFPTSANGMDGYSRVIVEVEGQTIAELYGSILPELAPLSHIDQEAALKTEQMHVLSTLRNVGISVQVINQYRGYVFNGFSAIIPSVDVEKIKTIPGIVHVYSDFEIFSTDDTSNAQIGAPEVWKIKDANNVPVTGQGVVVGVIDTGIDYTHPNLGGCFGVGCRVIGGMDFANHDNDPKDDNKHGTHVAGIIGAKGDLLTGVAPDVTFRAYKVLRSDGVGYNSDVFLAVDQAVADHVNVINMSLGSLADNPDTSGCQIIDRAIASGISVVIAAGNSGYDTVTKGRKPYTVYYPGVCQNAITVANSSGKGRIDASSSAGPIRNYLKMGKPDLAAPGSVIKSTCLAGSFCYSSGTSMAAPQVTGAVALLLQLHPDWTPARIKAVLMNNTEPEYIMTGLEQGAGFMRVDWAAKAPLVTTPARYDFGEINLSGRTSAAFTMTNLDTQVVSVDASISAHLVMTDDVNIQRTNAYLPANQITAQPSHIDTMSVGSFSPITVALSLSGTRSGYYEGVLVLNVTRTDDPQTFVQRVPISFWVSSDVPIYRYEYIPNVYK